LERLLGKGKRRHADQREYWRNVGGFGRFIESETRARSIVTINPVTLSGSRAEVRFTTLRGRSKNGEDGRRRGGKVDARD